MDCVPFYHRCRSLGGGRDVGTPLFDSAFVWVGLNCGSEERRNLKGMRRGRSQTGPRLPVSAHVLEIRREAPWGSRRGLDPVRLSP